MRLSSILRVVYSLCLTITLAQGVSLSKPGCPEKCGNVTIPYPFGIGSKCSANSSFTIICQNATNPPKPFLSIIRLEALEFSLDNNIVRVMQAVSPLNCSSGQTVMTLGKSVLGSPFTVSCSYNRLAVVGCQKVVWLLDNRTSTVYGGCTPICRNNSISDCNGINCCQATIPQRIQEPIIVYKTNEGNDSFCGYAFLVDHRWLVENYTSFHNFSNKSLVYVPVVLEWKFDLSEVTLQGAKCEKRGEFYSPMFEDYDFDGINTTLCHCEPGFEGNPYPPGGGCQYIDECSNTTVKPCIFGTCINKNGSFTSGST